MQRLAAAQKDTSLDNPKKHLGFSGEVSVIGITILVLGELVKK